MPSRSIVRTQFTCTKTEKKDIVLLESIFVSLIPLLISISLKKYISVQKTRAQLHKKVSSGSDPQANRTTKTWRPLRFKRKMSVAFQFFFLQCSDLSDFKMFKSIKHNKIIKLYYESHRQHNRQSLWTMTKLINKVTLNNFCSEKLLGDKKNIHAELFISPLNESL